MTAATALTDAAAQAVVRDEMSSSRLRPQVRAGAGVEVVAGPAHQVHGIGSTQETS